MWRGKGVMNKEGLCIKSHPPKAALTPKCSLILTLGLSLTFLTTFSWEPALTLYSHSQFVTKVSQEPTLPSHGMCPKLTYIDSQSHNVHSPKHPTRRASPLGSRLLKTWAITPQP